MRFALIPSVDQHLNDRYFFTEDGKGNKVFKDDYSREYFECFSSRGDEVHTIDMYDDLSSIDYVILEWPSWTKTAELLKAGLLGKTIYYNAEPPTVIKENCAEGFKRLKGIFPYILTYNSDWVDGKSTFKRPIHYVFENRMGEVPFKDRKLITGITAYKRSGYRYELYTEREKVYSFFENRYPDDFDFYGYGWDGKGHPGYKGCVKDKTEVYHDYRFAICLENTSHVMDYVTEKIYDCLCAGIVPVYGGADNISDYVPKECYIDYFSFKNYEEMADHLINMTEEEYNGYIDAIKAWLNTDVQNGHRVSDIIDSVYEAISVPKDHKVSFGNRTYINIKAFGGEAKALAVRIKKRLNG